MHGVHINNGYMGIHGYVIDVQREYKDTNAQFPLHTSTQHTNASLPAVPAAVVIWRVTLVSSGSSGAGFMMPRHTRTLPANSLTLTPSLKNPNDTSEKRKCKICSTFFDDTLSSPPGTGRQHCSTLVGDVHQLSWRHLKPTEVKPTAEEVGYVSYCITGLLRVWHSAAVEFFNFIILLVNAEWNAAWSHDLQCISNLL